MPSPRSAALAAKAREASGANKPAATPKLSGRSTSSGSTSVGSPVDATDTVYAAPFAPWQQDLKGVDTLYPVPPVLKNTFLEYTDLRTPSLDEWVKERECRSCPVSARRQPSLDELAAFSAGLELLEASALQELLEDGASGSLAGESADSVIEPAPAPPPGVFQDDGYVLRLADVLGAPGEGGPPPPPPPPEVAGGPWPTAGLPSVGSMGHHLGQCKVCAFIEKGCTNGQNCPFCHLCDASALRQLKKEKTRWRKMCREQRRTENAW